MGLYGYDAMTDVQGSNDSVTKLSAPGNMAIKPATPCRRCAWW